MKRKHDTKDGLGHIYQAMDEGKCICYFARASCPIHATVITSSSSDVLLRRAGMMGMFEN